MADWLELELSQHLAPVEAPAALDWRTPLCPAPRSAYTLAPLLATAAAVALLLLAAPHRLSNPAGINRYFRAQAGIDLPIPDNTHARIVDARILVRGGARMAAVTYRIDRGETTVLIAQASAALGRDWTPHGRDYVISSAEPHLACLLCHSNL